MAAVMIIGFFAIGAGLVVSAIRHSKRTAQERAHALQSLAADMGWQFREEVAFKSIPDLDRFELFRTGSSRQLCNLLTSPDGDPRLVVFDYAYTVSSGKSQQVHRQTVVYATSDRLTIPSFSLRPENFLHRIGSIFGYQDIDLERRPEFSRLFLLRGEDEAAVRAVFSDDVASFFETRSDFCATGAGHELLLWRPSGLEDVQSIRKLINDGTSLCALVTR